MKARAAPECAGLGWVYHEGYCYLFTRSVWSRGLMKSCIHTSPSVHTQYLAAEEKCNEVGGYLADVLTADENNFIKSVLNVVNPKVGS